MAKIFDWSDGTIKGALLCKDCIGTPKLNSSVECNEVSNAEINRRYSKIGVVINESNPIHCDSCGSAMVGK